MLKGTSTVISAMDLVNVGPNDESYDSLGCYIQYTHALFYAWLFQSFFSLFRVLADSS
jgi:hypothetical protein